MRTIEFAIEGGRTKVIERRMFVNCHVCGQSIECPDGTVEWVWLKSPDVLAFYETHRAHGSARSVGAEVQTVEKE